MPKAMVATMTTGSPLRKRASEARFSIGLRPAWKGRAVIFLSRSFFGGAFGFGAAAAIDDAGFVLMQFQKILQLLGFAGLRLGSDMQVRAVEAGGEDVGVSHVQPRR